MPSAGDLRRHIPEVDGAVLDVFLQVRLPVVADREIMRDDGYVCGLSGKWHLGDNLKPSEGFGFWITKPDGHTKEFYNQEIIEDGKTGFLATPEDPDDFAERIQQIADHPDLRRRLSESTLERARRNFAVQVTVANFLKVYEMLGVINRA